MSSSTMVASESLWAAFPHLSALTCRIDWRLLTVDTTLQFPATLRSLDLTVSDAERDFRWSHFDVLLSVVVRSPLARLRVGMPDDESPDGTPPVDSIERLMAIRDTITDLELKWERTRGVNDWESGHIAVFRSMTHLTRLHASNGEWSSEGLEMLLAMPGSLPRLRSLDLEHTQLGASDCLALARLPSLSEVRMETISPSAALAQMAGLETVAVAMRSDNDPETDIDLAHALASCTLITRQTPRSA